jgi:Bacterial Ig-like domain (group 3)
VFTLTTANFTATGLVASPNQTVFGQEITLNANVTSSGNPSGNVEFFDVNSGLGSAPLSGGTSTLKTTGLSIGAHTLRAEYAGDGVFQPSRSTDVSVTVNRAQTATTLASLPNPSGRKQLVTVTATVAAVAPAGGTSTGQVQLMEGKKKLATASLVNGVAAFQVTFTSMGQHVLAATYVGDANFNGSISPPLTQTVSK